MTGFTWMLCEDPMVFHAMVQEAFPDREIENNLPLGICRRLEKADEAGCSAFLYIAREDGRVTGAAVMTPPRNVILLSGPRWGREDHLLLADALIQMGHDVPGVIGPAEHAKMFASVWAGRRQTASIPKMDLGLYALETVRTRPGPGRLAPAVPEDSDLLWDWFAAFHRDCFDELPAFATRENSDNLLARGDVFFWELEGAKVAMAARSHSTERTTVVNLVYTPPPLRCRGHASSLVASLSEKLLESGTKFCVLFTDMKNPVSNSIYMKIGYEFVSGFSEYAFIDGS